MKAQDVRERREGLNLLQRGILLSLLHDCGKASLNTIVDCVRPSWVTLNRMSVV